MARIAEGGGVSFEDFFAAIAGQESGGNYNAVNPRTGASGKYQILPSNIGPWSEQYLGKRISVDAFRRSPQLQEKLARAVLKSYYDAYGARGAAAAWYSGSPSKAGDYHRFRPDEPSVGEYVDQVLYRAGHGSTLPKQAAPPTIENAPLATPTADIEPMGQALGAPENPGLGTPSGVDALAAPTFDTFGSTLGQTQADSALGAAGQTNSLGMTVSVGSGHGSNPLRDRIISEAMQFIGTPYVWGGASPNGFDCSGLIQYVFGQNGIALPRISADQAKAGRRVGLDQLRPGDLVATDNSPRNAGADHIAIWLGNGQILEAPKPGSSVRVRNIGKAEGYYGVALDI